MEFMTFTDMLRRAAWRKPDQVLLHSSDSGEEITYARGEILSDRIAGILFDLGVRKGDRVALFAPNSVDYVLAMFGIWKLGAISTHIPLQQKDYLDYFVHDSAPVVLFFLGAMSPAVSRFRESLPEIQHYIALDDYPGFGLSWSQLLAEDHRPVTVPVDDTDPAHLSYTSGSSGPPKGALLRHGPTARATQAIAERMELSSEDISLGVTSLASSFHLVANLLPGVHRAVNIGIRARWDAAEVWQEMEDRQITYFVGNPLVLADLLDICRQRGTKPSALKKCLSGGAPVPPALKKAYYDELNVALVESYGQSELGGFLAMGYPHREPDDRFTAIGPGLPDRETMIADEQGNEQPVGEPGELVIRGGAMVGYWNMPKKTAEVIRAGWLHTGDMGSMDQEGYYTLLGRWSERIVSSGRIIYPRRMEETLLSHPAVHYAGVIGKYDPLKGQVPLGIVELHPHQSIRAEELMAYCRSILGESDSPADILIVFQMPMTPTGKIGKQELMRIYGQNAG